MSNQKSKGSHFEGGKQESPLDSAGERKRVEQVEAAIGLGEAGQERLSRSERKIEEYQKIGVALRAIESVKDKKGLEEGELTMEEIRDILENSDDPEIASAIKANPNFAKEVFDLRSESREQAEVAHSMAQRGERAKKYGTMEIGGPAGKLLGQIEKNPEMAAACAIAGLAGMLVLARKDKSVGEWVSGLALSGVATYFGLEMFGKTEGAKKLFAQKLNDIIEDPTGRGKEAVQALKGVFEKGVDQIFGEGNVEKALLFLMPFIKDIPGAEWMKEILDKKKAVEDAVDKVRDAVDRGKDVVGSTPLGRVAGQTVENLLGVEEVEEKVVGGENEQVSTADGSSKETEKDLGRELSSPEKLEVSEDTRRDAKNFIENQSEQNLANLIGALAGNEAMVFLDEVGIPFLTDSFGRLYDFREWLMLQYFGGVKRVVEAKYTGSADDPNFLHDLGPKLFAYVKEAPKYTPLFFVTETWKHKSIAKGISGSLIKSFGWAKTGIEKPAIVTFKGGKFIYDKVATKGLRESIRWSVEFSGRRLSAQGLVKVVERIPKVNLAKFAGSGFKLLQLFKLGGRIGSAVGGAIAVDMILPKEAGAGENETVALKRLLYNLELTGLSEEKLTGDWASLNQNEKELIRKAFQDTNESLNSKNTFTAEGEVKGENKDYKPGLEIFEIPKELLTENESSEDESN